MVSAMVHTGLLLDSDSKYPERTNTPTALLQRVHTPQPQRHHAVRYRAPQKTHWLPRSIGTYRRQRKWRRRRARGLCRPDRGHRRCTLCCAAARGRQRQRRRHRARPWRRLQRCRDVRKARRGLHARRRCRGRACGGRRRRGAAGRAGGASVRDVEGFGKEGVRVRDAGLRGLSEEAFERARTRDLIVPVLCLGSRLGCEPAWRTAAVTEERLMLAHMSCCNSIPLRAAVWMSRTCTRALNKRGGTRQGYTSLEVSKVPGMTYILHTRVDTRCMRTFL